MPLMLELAVACQEWQGKGAHYNVHQARRCRVHILMCTAGKSRAHYNVATGSGGSTWPRSRTRSSTNMQSFFTLSILQSKRRRCSGECLLLVRGLGWYVFFSFNNFHAVSSVAQSQLKKLFFGVLHIHKPQDAADPGLALCRPATTFIMWEALKKSDG
jgi:hypothetical protein